MNINKISDISPSFSETVFILSADKKEIKESWIIVFGENSYWSHGEPWGGGCPLGYAFEDYPYWISKNDILKVLEQNNE